MKILSIFHLKYGIKTIYKKVIRQQNQDFFTQYPQKDRTPQRAVFGH